MKFYFHHDYADINPAGLRVGGGDGGVKRKTNGRICKLKRLKCQVEKVGQLEHSAFKRELRSGERITSAPQVRTGSSGAPVCKGICGSLPLKFVMRQDGSFFKY
jgi:hypothetical protein